MEYNPHKYQGDDIPKKNRRDLIYDFGSANNINDMSRIFLFSFILIAAILGGYYTSVSGKPDKVIQRSVNKSLKYSFRASMEGTISMKGIIINTYRSHQKYEQEHGLSILSYISSPDSAPYNAAKSIEILRYANNISEYGREDMYGHGTRHFGGTFKFPENDDSVAHVFEYWIDMRTLLAVRLDVVNVERNASTDSNGNPVAKEIYLNFRYYNWH